jgi:hypothetical protein
MREVAKKEVIKLLDAGIIYPVPHNEWVSPVHCVPKKGGLTVVKNVAFDFDEKCLAAFRTLKSVLVSAPIIQPPDWSQPFEIMCDASDYAVVAVLGQRKEGRVHAVCYQNSLWGVIKLCHYGKGVASGSIRFRKIQILHRELEGHCLHRSRSHQVSLG